MHSFDIISAINAASGLLFIVLGVFVVTVNRASRPNRAFGLFAIPFGVAFFLWNVLRPGDPGWAASRMGVAIALFVATAALVWLGLLYPRPVTRSDRRSLWAAAILAMTQITYTEIVRWSAGPPPDALALAPQGEVIISMLANSANSVYAGCVWGLVLLFALRHRRLPAEANRDRRGLALVTGALVLYPAYVVGKALLTDTHLRAGVATPLDVAMIALPVFVVAVGWLLPRPVPRSRVAPGLALVTLSFALVGMLSVRSTAGLPDDPGLGLARTAGVMVLGYAIVRHQLLDIDVKVRWTISKTTLAGVFVAVFFVASELGTLLFEGLLGGPVLGIMAAGALVFAFAPLSRLADRLAEKAVPATDHGADASDSERLREVYRTAVRHALANGTVSRREERYLADLATELRLDASSALSLREEVEHLNDKKIGKRL